MRDSARRLQRSNRRANRADSGVELHEHLPECDDAASAPVPSQSGGIPCALVYSSRKHCSSAELLTSLFEVQLRSAGYEPKRLTDEMRSCCDYLDGVRKLITECALGVVFLDGLRPNVTFEFGWLLGCGKPVILLASRGASVSVRTYYATQSDSGLGPREFEKLKDPALDPGRHLSDFGGKHVAFFDAQAGVDADGGLKKVLDAEIRRSASEIQQEVLRMQKQPLSEDVLKKVTASIVLISAAYFANQPDVEPTELAHAYADIKGVMGDKTPPLTCRLMAELHLRRAHRLESDKARSAAAAHDALDVFRDMARASLTEPDSSVDALLGIGRVALMLAELTEDVKYITDAVIAYEQVIRVEPQATGALVGLGISLNYRANHESTEDRLHSLRKARIALRSACDVEPTNPTAQGSLGSVLLRLARRQTGPESENALVEARECLRRALDLDPSAKLVTCELGVVMKLLAVQQGDPSALQAACKQLEDATHACPECSVSWREWGSCLTAKARRQDVVVEAVATLATAIDALNRADQLEPSSHINLCDLAEAQTELAVRQQPANSAATCEVACNTSKKALELEPKCDRMWYNWGRALQRLAATEDPAAAIRHQQDACEKFAKTMQLAHDHEGALFHWGESLARLAELQTGQPSLDALRDACDKFKRLDALQPGDVVVLRLWGHTAVRLAQQLGNSDSAARYLRASCRRFAMAFELDKEDFASLNNWNYALLQLARVVPSAERPAEMSESARVQQLCESIRPGGCSLSLACVAEQDGHRDEALKQLAIALETGCYDWDDIDGNRDLKNLEGDEK